MSGSSMERKTYEAGQPVFLEGDDGDMAFLIEDGAIMVYKRLEDGQEQSVALLRRGDILGEMALVDNAPRAASAKALETTKVALIPRDMFQSRVDRSDPIVKMLLKVFVQRLRSATEKAISQPKQTW